MSKNVLIMAAGTGGHVFPALACAKEFQARGYTVHWLGTATGIENDLVPNAGINLERIDMAGVRGKGLLALLKAPFNVLKALLQARKILKRLKPVCVMGMGGYVTGPGGLAAKTLGIPLVIHEQNAVAGTANRALANYAARICQAFPDTFASTAKCHTTGNPVRAELFNLQKDSELTERLVNLLVLGGSLGAEPLNKLLPEALALLPADIRPVVKHQAGKKHAQLTQERYQEAQVEAEVVPFISDMAQAYQWADLVICRSGALTVSEIAAAGVASFLIPLPHAIDDHQTRNAEFLTNAGAAQLLVQHTTDAGKLAAQLTEVLMNKQQLKLMGDKAHQLAKPKATEAVVDICLEVAHA
ncbi:undecaprenyldiphospho-muramoylpentapeptide beta-N-acetylglucosaminyltransferase [Pseudomonas sp. F1_0610]|uniref:undecaprenyldiphospho-muramoylpentapeptide beta-N-acetylglucosaminyltransferase n=1 Tax=Pseudomonas sp. F1_0610 TaxID=3114284 RepID=UPI0039C1D837